MSLLEGQLERWDCKIGNEDFQRIKCWRAKLEKKRNFVRRRDSH